MSNFLFLKDVWPDLIELAGDSENDILINKPQYALSKLRTFSEKLLRYVIELEQIEIPSYYSHMQKLRVLRDKKILPHKIYERFEKIQNTGSYAVHENMGTLVDALAKLESAYYLSVWAFKKYHNSSFEPRPFELPHQEQTRFTNEINKNTKKRKTEYSSACSKPSTINVGDNIDMDFSLDGLKDLGFNGFISIAHLFDDGLKEIPKVKGVYSIVMSNKEYPIFLPVSTGGWFKDNDPTVPIEVLEKKWVLGAEVLYIGKAGGSNKKSTLYSRIDSYMKFGQGKRVGHWGGRYIWQLKDSCDLLVAYKPISDQNPEEVEKQLITQFEVLYNRKPFANLI